VPHVIEKRPQKTPRRHAPREARQVTSNVSATAPTTAVSPGPSQGGPPVAGASTRRKMTMQAVWQSPKPAREPLSARPSSQVSGRRNITPRALPPMAARAASAEGTHSHGGRIGAAFVSPEPRPHSSAAALADEARTVHSKSRSGPVPAYDSPELAILATCSAARHSVASSQSESADFETGADFGVVSDEVRNALSRRRKKTIGGRSFFTWTFRKPPIRRQEVYAPPDDDNKDSNN